jgi:hypothetical protein
LVPDVPEEVEIQLERNQFINSKIVEKIEDEDFDEPEGQDIEELEEETEEEKIQRENDEKRENGLCGCCVGEKQHKKAKGKTKIRDLPQEYPVYRYPADGHNQAAWPSVIEKDPNAEKNKSRKDKSDLDEINLEETKSPKEPTATYY